MAVATLVVLLGVGAYVAYAWLVRPAPLPVGLIQANGRIEGDRVTVASKVPGRIRALHAREGDAVTEGQVVVELADREVRARVEQARQAVAAVEAQLQAARTSLGVLERAVPLAIERAAAGVAGARSVVARAAASERHARRDAARLRELAAEGIVDRHAAEQAALARDVARSELAAARAALVQADRQLGDAELGRDRIRAEEDEAAAVQAKLAQAKGGLAEAESVLADLTVVAPASGVVVTRIADTGEVVAAGAPLFDLVNLDRLYLQVYVPGVEIGKVRLGLPARIYADAFPDRPFPATVRYIASRAEFTPKEVQTPDERVKLVYAVRLYLDANPDHRLTPGLPADAVIRWQEGAPWAKPRW